jgi:hypothetical protein
MNLIDQLPPSIEWRIYSGDTARLTVIIRDADDQLVDLTDYTFDTTILPSNTVFDIQSTSPDGVVNTILRGTIVRELDVTR